MLQMDETLKTEEKTSLPSLLSSLCLEVDDIFFCLRKADRIIRRELNLLSQGKLSLLKKTPLLPVKEESLKKIINEFLSHNLLVDEYILYMLNHENNSIFQLIGEYNLHLITRKEAQERENYIALNEVDEKLVYCVRHLGAMTYHLNIHLNLLSVLLKNPPVEPNIQNGAIAQSQEIVTEFLVNEWGERQSDVRFLEITIDDPYALITWELEDLRGEAILLHNAGNWRLISISPGMYGLDDFQNAAVPLEVAQRMLELHHQKLSY